MHLWTIRARSRKLYDWIVYLYHKESRWRFRIQILVLSNECGIINTQISQDRAIISLLTPCQRVRSRSFRSGRYFSAYFAIRESSSFNSRLLLPLVGEPHRHKEQAKKEGRAGNRFRGRSPVNRLIEQSWREGTCPPSNLATKKTATIPYARMLCSR